MRTVLLVTKVPRPGRVKTRLTPFLQPAEASSLATAFLSDLVVTLQSVANIELILALPDGDDSGAIEQVAYAEPLITPGFTILRQGGGSLGDRLNRLVNQCFRVGSRTVTVVGSDHPNLPRYLLDACLSRADDGDVGWIPTEDGGFAALSTPQPWPELFRNVPWSTAAVAETVMANARAADVPLVSVGSWYDVDTAEDLVRLLSDPSTESTCPRTWQFLQSLAPPITHRPLPGGRNP